MQICKKENKIGDIKYKKTKKTQESLKQEKLNNDINDTIIIALFIQYFSKQDNNKIQ